MPLYAFDGLTSGLSDADLAGSFSNYNMGSESPLPPSPALPTASQPHDDAGTAQSNASADQTQPVHSPPPLLGRRSPPPPLRATTTADTAAGTVAETASTASPDRPHGASNSADGDILRYIIPRLLQGTTIAMTDGDSLVRFVPPLPPPPNASIAQVANYRAAMITFVSGVRAHLLGMIARSILADAGPRYEHQPLTGDGLKTLERRVLVPDLRAGFATATFDPVCTVCLKSFTEEEDEQEEHVEAKTGKVPHRPLSSPPPLRAPPPPSPALHHDGPYGSMGNLLDTQDEAGQSEGDANALSHNFTSLILPVGATRAVSVSDSDAVLAAAERDGKRIVCRLPCSHFFCFSCLKQWLAETASCPNCRAPVRPVEEQYAKHPGPAWWRREPPPPPLPRQDLESIPSLGDWDIPFAAPPPQMTSRAVAGSASTEVRMPAYEAAARESPVGLTDVDYAMYDVLVGTTDAASSDEGEAAVSPGDHAATRSEAGAVSSAETLVEPPTTPFASYDWGFGYMPQPPPQAPTRLSTNNGVTAPSRAPSQEISAARPSHVRTPALRVMGQRARPSPAISPSPSSATREEGSASLPSLAPQPPTSPPKAGPFPRAVHGPSPPAPRVRKENARTDVTYVRHTTRPSPGLVARTSPAPPSSTTPSLFPRVQMQRGSGAGSGASRRVVPSNATASKTSHSSAAHTDGDGGGRRSLPVVVAYPSPPATTPSPSVSFSLDY